MRRPAQCGRVIFQRLTSSSANSASAQASSCNTTSVPSVAPNPKKLESLDDREASPSLESATSGIDDDDVVVGDVLGVKVGIAAGLVAPMARSKPPPPTPSMGVDNHIHGVEIDSVTGGDLGDGDVVGVPVDDAAFWGRGASFFFEKTGRSHAQVSSPTSKPLGSKSLLLRCRTYDCVAPGIVYFAGWGEGGGRGKKSQYVATGAPAQGTILLSDRGSFKGRALDTGGTRQSTCSFQ